MNNEYITIKEAKKVTEAKNKILADDFRDRLESDKKEFKEEIKSVEQKIEDSKNKAIETLGIFVALFTFISLEFQAFKALDELRQIAAITLIILGALVLFVLLLDLILNDKFSIGKITKHESVFQQLEKTTMMSSYVEEQVPNLLKPKSWGNGLVMRMILLFLSIVMLVAGIWLFIFPTQHIQSFTNDKSVQCR